MVRNVSMSRVSVSTSMPMVSSRAMSSSRMALESRQSSSKSEVSSETSQTCSLSTSPRALLIPAMMAERSTLGFLSENFLRGAVNGRQPRLVRRDEHGVQAPRIDRAERGDDQVSGPAWLEQRAKRPADAAEFPRRADAQ